jgi:hypothetical protein
VRLVVLKPLNAVNLSYFSALSLLLFFNLCFNFSLVNFISLVKGKVHSVEAIDCSVNCERAPKLLRLWCAFCGSD